MKKNCTELLALGMFGPRFSLGDRIAILVSKACQFSPRASYSRVTVAAIMLALSLGMGSRVPQWIADTIVIDHLEKSPISKLIHRPCVLSKP
jgi:hypothetical protein